MKATIRAGNPKSRLGKSYVKTMLIYFYDSKGVVHHELVLPAQVVTAIYVFGALMRLLHRIHGIPPEFVRRGI